MEDENVQKVGYHLREDYVLLKEQNITEQNLYFDIEIAAYLLSPTTNQYQLKSLISQYVGIEIDEILAKKGVSQNENKQMNLFETNNILTTDARKEERSLLVYQMENLEKIQKLIVVLLQEKQMENQF